MKPVFSRYFLLLLLIISSFFSAAAQDLIARQAPIDRRIKAVDSLTINRVIHKASFSNYESNDLYNSWNTSKVHCYSNVELPETHRIDLRGFHMPTPSRMVTSHFGYRPTFRRYHKGLDIKVYTGDTIVAAFEGKVRIVGYEASGYGNYVVIRHKNGLETIYGHLSKSIAQIGEVVKAGQLIGLGGNTGRSFGSHLHFETRFLGIAIDPTLLFDFPNQDVTADYFVFNRSDCQGGLLTQVGGAGSQQELAQVDHPNRKEFPNNQPTHPKSQPQVTGNFYQVKNGDTLYSISRKIGISVEDISRFNNLGSKPVLHTGQILRY